MQKPINQGISWAILCGGAVWGLLLLSAATKTINPHFTGTYDLRIGPLVLNRFVAEAGSDGTRSITLSLAAGLFGYGMFWVLLGAIAGYAMAKKTRL